MAVSTTAVSVPLIWYRGSAVPLKGARGLLGTVRGYGVERVSADGRAGHKGAVFQFGLRPPQEWLQPCGKSYLGKLWRCAGPSRGRSSNFFGKLKFSLLSNSLASSLHLLIVIGPILAFKPLQRYASSPCSRPETSR